MQKHLILVKIDQDYCNYLRKFDEKVPYNYAQKKDRPFVGVLFKVDNCMYFAPLSSPKPKHIKLKNKIDFLKIDLGRLGAINFNNMIPVKMNNILKINLNNNKEYDVNYIKLLSKQINWLNRNSERLYKSSKKLYDCI